MNKQSKHLLTIIAATCLSVSVSSFAQDESPRIPVQPVNAERLPDTSGVRGTPVTYQGGDALRRSTQIAQDPSLAGALDEYGRPINRMAIPQTPQEPDFLREIRESFKPEQSYALKPGRNVIMPVGQGYTNVIRTNFESLSVRTSASSDDAVLQIEEGNLYATLRNHRPISLIIGEDGVLESEISVVLVPLNAPPAIINVDVELTPEMLVKASEHQERLKQEIEQERMQRTPERNTRNNTHTNNLAAILTPVAQGNIPSGFSMTNDIPLHMRQPCRIAVPHETLQRLTGARELIDIVLVRNETNRAYQVREEMCLTDGVLATAIFSKAFLQPGEETEIYIVRDRYYQSQEQRQTRPRLTSGGAR